jgi:glycine oxidase
LGHHPIETGAYIANGGFKIGLAMAPKMAQVLADYIIDGVDTIPQDFVPNFAK